MRILLLLLITNIAWAQLDKEILTLYREGAYHDVIDSLEVYRKESKELEKVYYWLGMSYSKLQEFDDAIAHFKKAILLDDSAKDIYYQYGQALYGNENFRKAREAFRKSYQRNFSRDLSLYYMGHISQRLAEHAQAARYYKKIVESDEAGKDLIQAAYYQMALSKLENAKSRKGTLFIQVRDEVLPLLELAYDEDQISKLSLEIRNTMFRVRKKYNLPMKRKEKKKSFRFKQSIVWDTNVNLSPGELANTPPSNRESLISKTEVQAKIRKRFLKKTRTTFELASKFDYHFNRDEGSVYQYDRIEVSPAIRNEFRHRMFKRDFNFLFDVEYDQVHQDYQQENAFPFYNRRLTVSIGERFRFFDTGATLFKIKRKQYYSYDSDSNFSSNSLSLIQFIKLKNDNILLVIFNYDNNNATNETNSNTNYYIRGDYLIPGFWGAMDVRIGSGFGFLDTELQMPDRGTEIMLTPGIEFTFNLFKKISMALNYQYTRNFSKDDTLYDYTKQEIGLELTASF